MATTTINTRISLRNATTDEWAQSTLVLLKGEVALENTTSGDVKVKVGDGVKTFAQLPYITMSVSEINDLLQDGSVHSVSLASGTNNGTLKLTVDGKATDNVAVTGLGSAAYTDSDAYATAAQGTLATNAVRSVTTGTANGTISVTTGTGTATDVPVKGLASAAYRGAGNASGNVPVNGASLGTTANVPVVTNTSGQLVPHASGALGTAAFQPTTAFATATQGTKADSAVQSVALASGTNNGTLKLTVNGTATDNIAVKGLGSAAYTASSAYATAGHTHTNASDAAAGFMSADDKAKLDGIEEGAQANTITGVKGSAETTYRTGQVNITAANIGLGNVNNTADSAKSVASAAKLTAAKTISLTGDVTGSVSTDFSNNASIATTVVNDSHTHSNATITSLDASKLTGTIAIERLPQGALERLVVVADDTARFALTTDDVQIGDTVKVTGTGLMYFVKDDSKLDSADGYEIYTAGAATSVPWSGVTGRPSSMKNPYALTVSLNGTSQGAYDGSAAKSINITPTSIGAAAASHGTHVTYSTTAPLANGTASVGTAATVSRSDHVHPLQTSVSGNAGTATKLATARTIALTTAVTSTATSFNGSANISIPINSLNTDYLVNGANTLVLSCGGAA